MKSLLNEVMGDTSKGIFQIEECDMDCPASSPGIFDDLLNCLVVLYAPIDARKEGFLHGWVHQLVGETVRNKAVVEQEMECLPNTTADTPADTTADTYGSKLSGWEICTFRVTFCQFSW